MTGRRGPPWLAALQAGFGEVLRHPLDRSSGRLRARTDRYPQPSCDLVRETPDRPARERLAVYHRQYWFRLLTAMQEDFPLLTALMGHWEFNGWAAGYLRVHPPRGGGLQRLADGFLGHLDGVLPSQGLRGGTPELVPRAALLEAAAIDAAWREVLLAEEAAPFDPAGLQAEGWASLRLGRRPGFGLVSEHWPLCDLRRRVGAAGVDRRAPLPPRHGRRRWVLFGRAGARLFELEVPPRQAQLLELLEELPVGEALAVLEARCRGAERDRLPAQVERWLAQGVELGLFAAVSP
ncbi:MAG: putative DNA-binding domain-containing protein [Anaeromyxobacter sp.]|nr:putative DNA-binding domain-containing protein [Anaeromyxobacter sp.]MBL0274858.1 putative DNA-binding domain-containing protein [Anaeromyxobacter sp.]